MMPARQRWVHRFLFPAGEEAPFGAGFLFAMLSLGFAVRLAMLWLVDYRFDLGDAGSYLNAARHLLDLHIYSESETLPIVSTFNRPPVYSFFLASVMAIFGRNIIFIQLLQMVISLGTGLLATRIAAHFSAKAAPWVLLMMMLSPFEAVYSATVLSESVTTFLLLAAFCAVVTLSGRGRWVASGALFGLCALTRDIYWPLTIALACLWGLLGEGRVPVRVKQGVTFLLCFAIVVAPWTIRNYRTAGRFIPISEGRLGISMWIGTWAKNGHFTTAYLSGAHVYPAEAFRTTAEKVLIDRAEAPGTAPKEADAIFKSVAISRFKEEPLRVLRTYLVRQPLLWFGTRFEIFPLNGKVFPAGSVGWRAVKSLFWGINAVFVVAALAGMLFAVRRRDKVLVLALPLIYTALLYLPFNSYENRYSQPVYPFLLILSAFALVQVAEALQLSSSRRFKEVAGDSSTLSGANPGRRQSWALLHRALEMWRGLQSGSTNRRIFGAIVTISSLTAVIKLVNIAKEILVASRFGTSDQLDAFLIAFMIPTFCIGIVANSFNAALIPTFIRVRENQGMAAAQRLFANTTLFSISLLALLSVLLAFCVPQILAVVAGGFGPEKLLLTRRLFYCLLPIVVLNGISTTWSAIINAGERFVLTAVAPVMRPLALVLFLFLCYRQLGVFAMAAGTVTGVVLEIILLGFALRRRGIGIVPRWHGMSEEFRLVLRQYLPISASVFFMSSAAVIDQSFAARLLPGSVSVLSYGNKIVSLLLELSATALGTAVLPHFSRMIAGNDWDGFRHTLKTYGRVILCCSIPVVALLVIFSEPLVAFAFRRGAFTAADATMAASIQSIYALQIPVYMLCIMVVRAISAVNLNKVLMWAGAQNLVCTIGFDYLFVRMFGICGIPLSGLCVYLAGLTFAGTLLWRHLRRVGRTELGGMSGQLAKEGAR
jgi:putative peptidoglycan lipid II flippase